MRNLNSPSPAIEGEPSTGHQDTTLDLNVSGISFSLVIHILAT